MKAGKGFQKEWEEFCADFEEKVSEMLVLIGEHTGGASSWTQGIWRPTAEFLGSTNLEGESMGEGQLCWLAEDKDREKWIFDLKPLTVYRVKCRKIKAEKRKEDVPERWANAYLLVDVVKRGVRNEFLEQVLEEYKKPVTITDELCGKFELERAYNWFRAKLDWLGTACSVSLECDEQEKGTTADGALAAFREIYANREEWDKKFRAFAAKELTELAREWQDEEDYDEDETPSGAITEESFAGRICISEFTIDADGAYTAYYEDDDMFFGHVILISGSLKEGMKDADIAG